jgi:hypothetical protein
MRNQQAFDFVGPAAPGGSGSGVCPPPLAAALGIGGVEIRPPSYQDLRGFWDRVIGIHHVRPGHAEVPYTKGLSKLAIGLFGAMDCLVRLEAPTVTALFTVHGKHAAFTPDMSVELRYVPKCLEPLGVSASKFFVHVQSQHFVDRENLEAGYTALRMATGLSVITLGEIELIQRRHEFFHV